MIPCDGVYADIRKEDVKLVDEDTPGMEKLFQAYEKYKNQGRDEIEYPLDLIEKGSSCIF